MKTKEFLSVLKENEYKSLKFEYAPKKLVGANYHITEVKHIQIDSVDCGGKTDAWKETIIQLWESPKEIEKREFMKVDKALSILDKVGKMRSYDYEAEVKIEYSNATFHTAQLFVNDFEINDDSLIVKLSVEDTRCKANDICGIPEKVIAVASNESCCTPESGCC